ncbi:uncharacterized protein LOC122153938 [Tyto alba]|uniref:uncharacterized protein LOC122153938 n=1 Tax=Tyto alba TaxID=56313 RepID=UPI001C6740A0|nr:uncharacterized protein LOC122153938 [Tyto alba]
MGSLLDTPVTEGMTQLLNPPFPPSSKCFSPVRKKGSPLRNHRDFSLSWEAPAARAFFCQRPTAALSFTQPQLYPTSALQNLSFTEPQLYRTSALPNLSFTEPQLYPTSALPNLSFTQPQLYPTSALPNLSFTKHDQNSDERPNLSQQVRSAGVALLPARASPVGWGLQSTELHRRHIPRGLQHHLPRDCSSFNPRSALAKGRLTVSQVETALKWFNRNFN